MGDFNAGRALKRKIVVGTDEPGLVGALNRNTERLDELIRAGFKVHGASTDVGVLLTQLKDVLQAVRESHELSTKEHIAEMRAHREAMAEVVAETKALREATDRATAALDRNTRAQPDALSAVTVRSGLEYAR